jgi:predicted DNA-binding transcriptional regulator AlpA
MNFFSEYLNTLVRNHSDSISKIAHNAELSRPSFYDLINGKNLPRNSTLTKICTALSLSEIACKKLQNLNQAERLRTSRKEQKFYYKEKKHLVSEMSTKLLAKGHEISRPKGPDEADLILRQNTHRFPILIFPSIPDPSIILGRLLTYMFHLSASKGYICTPDIKLLNKKTIQLFSSHRIKVLSAKGLLREFNSFP